MSELFLDTAYALALSITDDAFHLRAIHLADQLTAAGTRLVTTRAVLLEIGNALSKQRYRPAGVRLLQSLELDPAVEIIPLSDQLYIHGLRLHRERPDKEWSLVDCISFLVMQDRGITAALTTDLHFQQAGFRVLLREGTL
jgi:predicted nucleic acid-binding protein